MPLRETEAVVLRTYRLGIADKIVSFFPRQFGRPLPGKLAGEAEGLQLAGRRPSVRAKVTQF